jgi:phage tail sheath protein FI
VLTGTPPNSPASVDQGRFIVELQVAPSVPLRFLTIRLVSTGEDGLQIEAA